MGDSDGFDLDSPAHLRWLAAEDDRLIEFASAAVDPSGGFAHLDTRGRPVPGEPQHLYAVARLVHCFSLEHVMGRPGADALAQHGMDQLRTRFADPAHGGFSAWLGDDGNEASHRKAAYGHAFALLAGASGMRAGIGGAVDVFDRARAAFDDHFWDAGAGASHESFDRAFAVAEEYRGQNSNMHLTEAYLAAYEATRDERFIERAELLAERFVLTVAEQQGWRIPEHYTADWRIDPSYNLDRPNDPFRPYGALVGHSLEWARLLLQLRALRPTAEWTLAAAEGLFAAAIADGWDAASGGFLYSVDDRGVPVNPSRMHWSAAEGVGAALWLYRATGRAEYRHWYATIWAWIDANLIDRDGGSWWHELDEHNRPAAATWNGKPDLYHAWQATLYARVAGDLGIGEAASSGRIAPLAGGAPRHDSVPVLEIGGTHLTAALVSTRTWSVIEGTTTRTALHSSGTRERLIAEIVRGANELGADHGSEWVVAIPGPFDYEQGIGRFEHVGKFDSLRGVDVGKELEAGIRPRPSTVRFLNDADAFGVGEYTSGAAAGVSRVVCITLGTGIGSAYLVDGEPSTVGPGVPPDGSIHLLEFRGRPLEETVSRRAILSAYGTAMDVASDGVIDVREIAELARSGDQPAATVLTTAFESLGAALASSLADFGATRLVIGGSMAQSWDLVEPAIRAGLQLEAGTLAGLEIRQAAGADDAPLVGAAFWAARQPPRGATAVTGD